MNRRPNPLPRAECCRSGHCTCYVRRSRAGSGRLREHRQLVRRQPSHLFPVDLRIEQPILGLMVLRLRFQQRDVDDVQHSRITAVFELTRSYSDTSWPPRSLTGRIQRPARLSFHSRPATHRPYSFREFARQTIRFTSCSVDAHSLPYQVCIAAAGMTRRSSLSSITVYSGARPDRFRLSRRMIGTPSPRRSIRCTRPRPVGVGQRARRETINSFRLACRKCRLSGVRVFASRRGRRVQDDPRTCAGARERPPPNSPGAPPRSPAPRRPRDR